MTLERTLFLVGLSHKSAPIAIREQVALTGDELRHAIGALKHMDGVGEAMVVSTCNRVEAYVFADTLEPARRFFLDRAPEANGHLYERRGLDAVRHLFRVSASLDSMVVGEQQILGQVKEAYGISSAVQAAGPFLSRLCNKAFATAKRIRSETDIGKGASSVSQVAVELVQKIFGDLRRRSILLVGAGKMGALSARALADLKADGILVANRSPERALAVARQVGGTARPWEDLPQLLVAADVVLVSTGAPSCVITREIASQAMRARRQRSICFIDLSVPRNVDPACADLDNVYVDDIDDLQKVISQTQAMRAEEAIHAEAVIEAEAMAFAREGQTRAALPVLGALRRRAEEIAKSEAERTVQMLGAKLDEKGRKSVEAMARAIVNKLLHGPTARLRQAAESGDSTLPGAAAQLFGIEEQVCGEAPSPGSEPDEDGPARTENLLAEALPRPDPER